MIRHESKPISIHINPHKVSSSIYIYKSIPNHTKSKEISGSSGNPPITRVAWHRSCRTWWHASPGRLCGTSPWCYRFSHGKTAGFQGRSPAETMGFCFFCGSIPSLRMQQFFANEHMNQWKRKKGWTLAGFSCQLLESCTEYGSAFVDRDFEV